METEMKKKICQKCGNGYEEVEGQMVCPHCGFIRWGEFLSTLLVLLIMTGVFIWLFFFVSPDIVSRFWRIVVKVGTAFWGIIFVFADIFFPIAIYDQHKSSKTALSHSNGTASSLPETIINEMKPMTPVDDVILQLVHPEAVVDITQGSKYNSQSLQKIDDYAIILANRSGDYEQMAQILCKLDQQSDDEYSANNAVSNRTISLIKYVGDILNRNGGEELMKDVLMRAGRMGCNTRFIEREWDGIGTWVG